MIDPEVRIDRFLHDTLEQAEMDELGRWIKADRANADQFVREVVLHSNIQIILRGASAYRKYVEVDSAASKSRLGLVRRNYAIAALAACLLLAATVMFFHLGSTHPDGIAGDVAVLGSSIDADWASPIGSGQSQSVPAGSYHLRHGLAMLKFACGSEVLVQGPADFAVSLDEFRLNSGNVVVSCPSARSRELILALPGANVVDLGTEYGAACLADGSSEVHVFQGSVRLTVAPDDPKILSSIVLTAGHGSKVDGQLHVATAIASPDVRFVRSAEFQARVRAGESGAAGTWASGLINQLHDPHLMFLSDFNPVLDGFAVANLADPAGGLIRAGEGSASPTFVPGRLAGDSAVTFEKPSDALRLHLPGQFQSLTFAAWVRLYPERPGVDPMRHRSLVLSDAWNKPGQVHWQVKGNGLRLSYFWHGDDVDPRFGANIDGLIGDGWHFLASEIQISPAATVSHFFDGREVYRRTIPNAIRPLNLEECMVGGWVPAPGHSKDDRTLNGAIDDLMIWGRALSANEIEDLYQCSTSAHQP